MSYPEITKIIVGVDSLKQLNEILFYDRFQKIRAPEVLATVDINLLDPWRWSKSNN
jgi:hypothetical protein